MTKCKSFKHLVLSVNITCDDDVKGAMSPKLNDEIYTAVVLLDFLWFKMLDYVRKVWKRWNNSREENVWNVSRLLQIGSKVVALFEARCI